MSHPITTQEPDNQLPEDMYFEEEALAKSKQNEYETN